MSIGFFRAMAFGISLAGAAAPRVYANAQNPPAESPSAGEERKLAGT